MSFNVSTSPTFDKEFKNLFKKYPSLKTDLLALITDLSIDPLQGTSLGKDCYKIRMKISSKGKGKSGGSRIITCVKIVNQQIKLLTIYDKSEKESISDPYLLQLLKESGLI